MMLPILLITLVLSIIWTFSDFQTVYALTGGGPINSTHLLATLSYQVGIASGTTGRRRGDLADDAAGAVGAGRGADLLPAQDELGVMLARALHTARAQPAPMWSPAALAASIGC